MKETLDILIHDPKFWTAVLFLVQTLLFLFVPGFPARLWEAISAVLVIVFASFTVKNTLAIKAERAKGRSAR